MKGLLEGLTVCPFGFGSGFGSVLFFFSAGASGFFVMPLLNPVGWPLGALSEPQGRHVQSSATPDMVRGEMSDLLPPEGTVERWAWDFVNTTVLESKLAPPAPPSKWAAPSQRWVLTQPGRPAELVQRTERKKAAKPGALKDTAKRAEVLHTFLHHELQAAELMAWAILAFPETPEPFRRGLLGILRDELRHMGLYRAHLETLGHPFGSMPIKDWFWERVPGESVTPLQFVAVRSAKGA